MTSADPFAAFRTPLWEAVDRAVDAVDYGYGKLMRQELQSLSGDEDLLLPGLLCLATADALGERSAEAMPAATALTLLSAMRRVFGDIAGDEGVLGENWGMPRALNAGDAFFAVAQRSLLDAAQRLDPERQAWSMRTMDAACRGLSVEMKHAEHGPTLYSAGAAFGALFAGADDPRVESLAAFGRDLDASRVDGSVSAEARRSLSDAAAYIHGRGGG
jgi:hypothetical protein